MFKKYNVKYYSNKGICLAKMQGYSKKEVANLFRSIMGSGKFISITEY